MSDLIANFCAITGTDETTGSMYLEMYGYDMEAAIAFFFAEDAGVVTTPPATQVQNSATQSSDERISNAIALLFRAAIPESWSIQGLSFNSASSEKWGGLGINQLKNGPCGVLAVFQATVISGIMGVQSLNPNFAISPSHIADGILTILKHCSRSVGKINVCTYSGPQFAIDDLRIIEIPNEDPTLYTQILSCVDKYTAPGGILLLVLAAVLTRGVDIVRRDMATSGGESTLVYGPFDICTSALTSLLMLGVADDNVSAYGLDGRKRVSDFKSPVGMLSAVEIENRIRIHDALKFPEREVYVLHGRDHFTTCFVLPKLSLSTQSDSIGAPAVSVPVSTEEKQQQQQQQQRDGQVGGVDGGEVFHMLHWNGLPPGGPRWTLLEVAAPRGSVSAAPVSAEEGLGVEYKPVVGSIDSIVQAYSADKQGRPHEWTTWRYEVALVIDDPSNTSPPRPADKPLPQTFVLSLLGKPVPPLGQSELVGGVGDGSASTADGLVGDPAGATHIPMEPDMEAFLRQSWRCRACFETRFSTMCFGINEGIGTAFGDLASVVAEGAEGATAEVGAVEAEVMLAQPCSHCGRPRREGGWTLWLPYKLLPPGWQDSVDRQYGPKILSVLRSKWPDCRVKFEEGCPLPSV